jgi:hypothetical protein
MKSIKERDNLLKSLEEHNSELTDAFEKYKEAKSIKWPDSDEDGEIAPKDQEIVVEIYYNHRLSLEKILECAGSLKKAMVELETYFNEGEKRQEELKKMFQQAFQEADEEDIERFKEVFQKPEKQDETNNI